MLSVASAHTTLAAMAHLDFENPLVEVEQRISELEKEEGSAPKAELTRLRERVERLERRVYEDLSVWQKVLLSRHPERPYFLDYIKHIAEDFVELHGDRAFRDDPAVVGGFCTLEGKHVAVVGQQKGRSTKQKVRHNFGMAHPEGYRKACRMMELADRFRRPIVTFIDTPGAYPGIGAEERGQSEAIGTALLTMASLRVPVIAIVIGEGGSGGALALGVANRVLMLQYSTYSVITPEGCASILWRDGAKAPDAAEQLKLTAIDAHRLGVVDGIIDEPYGGAHRNAVQASSNIARAIKHHLTELERSTGEELASMRYDRFRTLGAYQNLVEV